MNNAHFINVYDQATLRKTAVLENAYNITETQELNQIYSLSFSIPSSDPKVEYLQPFHYVRFGETGQLYRIIKQKSADSTTGTITVECEHVITTLCDTTMFGSFTYGGGSDTTANVIKWILSKQTTVLWEYGDCAFDRKFEYNWEQENLLNALYSVPKEFASAYYWDFDTSGNPLATSTKWKIYLRKIDSTINPEYYIRAKSNLLQSNTEQDFTGICTRIYPLGYGEGINQLTIRSVNPNKDANGVGLPYLQSPAAIVAQYGIKEKVLSDRRFENAESLMAYAQTMLDALQIPSMSRSFDVVDLYPITGQSIDNAQVGHICRMTGDGTTAYITKTVRVLDDPGNLQVQLSTKATDVVSQIADLADRVRIESVYAQGATQIYQHSKDANAAPVVNKNGTITKGKGMVINLYFPSEMKQINKVLLKLELKKFRSYSATTDSYDGESVDLDVQVSGAKTTSQSNTKSFITTEKLAKTSTEKMTASAGATLTSTKSGGGTGQTSTASSGVSVSGTAAQVWTQPEFQYAYTGAVGGQSTDEADGSEGDHSHEFSIPSLAMDKAQFSHNHNVSASGGSHSHDFSVPDHSHDINIAHTHQYSIAHQHTIPCPAHTHEINIPNLSGKVTIPPHDHKILPGIFEADETPTKFDIYVGSTKKASYNKTTFDGDITSWLLNAQKQIPRNTWISIEIVPNKLAYVVSSVFVQGFVQSRGGGNY